jgi:hypothetical protein
MLEWLSQYLVNSVKAREYKIISDIPEGQLDEFKRKSREAAMDVRDRCTTYWPID